MLEIINSLLTHLRHSVMSDVPLEFERDEKMYQEALINALGEFANHLPDYQKIEIMKFIMSKVPQLAEEGKKGASGVGNALLQNILLKSLLKVTMFIFTLNEYNLIILYFHRLALSTELFNSPPHFRCLSWNLCYECH